MLERVAGLGVGVREEGGLLLEGEGVGVEGVGEGESVEFEVEFGARKVLEKMGGFGLGAI
jgi:hypothetical protein